MSTATIINDVPSCLCHVVLGTMPTQPKLLYSSKQDAYVIYCPKCGYRTFYHNNKQAVISSWYTSNRPGDLHVKKCWIEKYNTLTGSAISIV